MAWFCRGCCHERYLFNVLGTSQDPYAMMVFCADKLDPLRGYDSTKLIEVCNKDIKEGFDLVVQQNREYLKRG